MSDRDRWERLQAEFHAAVAVPASQRAAYLNAACPTDPALRRELESLLAADPDGPVCPIEQAVGATAVEWLDEGRPSLAGRSLGPYRLDNRLAIGGMADVYKAYDDRLGRPVAVKVLAPYLSAGGTSRHQFEREARAIAALSHPNICPLFDVGSESGIDFLVMEYLEGETLAVRLKSGALGLNEALKIAGQVADALDRAHRAGIVHRDIKPGNVMLTRNGATLLDFGLASLHQSPHVVTSAAEPLFGTLRYMAPEQLSTGVADTRTDIWAFGCVVYEMLSGKPAFEADSREALVAAISDPGRSAMGPLPPYVPESIVGLLRACLARDPDERWQSAGDFRRALRWAHDWRRAGGAAVDRRHLRWNWHRSVALGLALAWTAVLSVAFFGNRAPRRAPTPGLPTYLSLSLPEGVSLDLPPAGSPIAIARDGRRIAFVGTREGERQLYVAALEREQPAAVADTDDASAAAFSPDGESLAFVANGLLKKIAISGGTPTTLGAAPPNPTLNWETGDRILMGGDGAQIREVPAGGGAMQEVTALTGDASHLYPVRLPADNGLLFTRAPSRVVALQRRGTAEPRRILSDAMNARLLRGTLIFGRAQALWGVAFDVRGGTVSGQPRPLVRRVLSNGSGVPIFALADNGTLVYTPPASPPTRALVLVDRSGREAPLTLPPRPYRLPRLSPDGLRVVVSTQDGDESLWVVDLRHPVLRRLTFAGRPSFSPVWSADGRQVFFSDMESILAIAADGSDPRAETILETAETSPTGTTPDGEQLLVHGAGVRSSAGGPGSHIGTVSLAGRRRLTPLITDPGNQRNPTISPDGRWLAYQSDESGQLEVFVRPFPDVSAGKWQVSIGGGFQPLWAHDGRTLFYRVRAGQVLAVPIRPSSNFAPGPPVVAVAGAYRDDEMSPARSYDVTPDGGRFLLIKAVGGTAVTKLSVIIDWDVEKAMSR